MDLASRARALFWALLGAFGPATVLDVNVAKSFFSAAALFIVLGGAVVVLRAGAEGVMAAPAGVGAFIDINFEGGLALALKFVNRCGESAAGLRAIQDINTATLYVQDSLCEATNKAAERLKNGAAGLNLLVPIFLIDFPGLSRRQHASSGPGGRIKNYVLWSKILDSKQR
jgi:hypothetical protein